MSVVNPVRVTRERLGLTREQLALGVDRSYTQIALIERGSVPRLAPTLRGGFESLGVDFDALCRDYLVYRAALAAEVRKAVANG